MAELPQTRDSLLLKLRDPDDGAAWERFVTVYRPAVYRLARRRGLQHADADDLAQQVMTAVAKAIGGWNRDSTRGTFRAWLFAIARNAIVNALTRGRHAVGHGGSSYIELLAAAPARDEAASVIEEEHRRAVFRWAADEVRGEFGPAAWLAFQLTAIDGLTTEAAAAKLGKSVGAVYASRSRVMRRLKELVRELDAE